MSAEAKGRDWEADIAACRRCDRLVRFLGEVSARHPDYHAAPVAAFGSLDARLLVVGLAPGMHGANRTGRPFTGDHAGIILYETLHRHGFASAPQSLSREDGLKLLDCRISNAVRCLPPQNKPLPIELRACGEHLMRELSAMPKLRVLLALGRQAHESILRAHGLRLADYPFGHCAVHALADGRLLFDSYHCSRYNTQTRRLTPESFDSVFREIRRRLS